MNYREKLYSTYVSSHTSHLYGKVNIEEIKRQFPVWKKYYGKFLPKDKNVEILDIGCGNGGFVYFLKTLGFKNAHGVDVSKEQVELAHKLGIEAVIHADLKEYLSGKEDTYHVIFARDVIEHFRKDEILEVLSLIFSSLKKEGRVIIQTPNGESPFGSRYRYWDFTHEIAFTRSSLNHVLRVVDLRKLIFMLQGLYLKE